MPHHNQMIYFDRVIDHLTINGDVVSLHADIKVQGHLDLSRLKMDMSLQGEAPLLQIGIDEAGRGPLLGSVNVAATILPSAWSGLIEEPLLDDTPLSTLTDSKKLSEKKRDTLYPLIQEHALGHIIVEVPAAVIDQLNILQATLQGMRVCGEMMIQALAEVITIRKTKVDILYDGNQYPAMNEALLTRLEVNPAMIESQAWVKGDARHTSIAAASVLAKVSRDQVMYAFDKEYPYYGIAKHKGYPTAQHMQAIQSYGVLPQHRRSFSPIKKALKIV